ncbi:MAG: hypothetical protein DRJ66_01170 [Thermoprotei archaeon]|nr:MAG: hypothetical protein DRJ66_01170 [Thermoprotei archaeon]
MVLTGTALIMIILILSTVVMTPKEYELFPFYLPWDDAEDTATSVKSWVSNWNRTIERVYIGEDGHLYVNNRRIKFFGVNIAGDAIFPRKEDAEKIAKRLAKLGVNLVRIHGLDAEWEAVNIFGGYKAKDTRHFDPEYLDRFDYFVAKLKENGIYISIGLLVARKFRTADGLPPQVEKMDRKDQHALIFIDPQIRELYKEFAYKLLMHRNPYTGMTYAEDPVVAFVEIVNEMGAWFWYLLTDLVSRLPSIYKEMLKEKWNEYLRARFGSIEDVLKAWGIKDIKAPVITSDLYWKSPQFIREAWIDFLWHLEAETFMEIYNFLKHEVGCKALIVATTCRFSPLNIVSKFDVVDAHAYWQHPKFPGTPWDPQNWYVLNEPMVNHPTESTIVRLASYRVYGKPFTVSEYDHPNPNMYGPEGTLILAIYAALQDWDGIIYFTYGELDDWDSRRLRRYFDIDQNPVKMALMVPAYMIYMRGDVRPANEYIVAELPISIEQRLLRDFKYADAMDVGFTPEMALIHRIAVITASSPSPYGEIKGPSEVILSQSVKMGVIESDTGEIIWDVSKEDRGIIIVNTNRTIALVGFIGKKSFDFGSIIIEVEDTILDGWGIVTLITKEDEDFNNWSRMLLIATGYVINKGMTIRDYETKEVLAIGSTKMRELGGLRGKKITCFFQWGKIGDWGEGPTLVEGLKATIMIRTDKEIEVWALDNVGKRVTKVPVLTKGEYKVFEIDPKYRTIWYEIIVKE